MTTEEQAKAMVDKYYKILPFKLAPNYAIKCAINCAITEVEACMKYVTRYEYGQGERTETEHYSNLNDILNHLKQM